MRVLRSLFVLLVLLGLAGVAAFFAFDRYIHMAGPLEAEKTVFVAPGSGVRLVAQMLHAQGALVQPYAFLGAVALEGAGGQIKAGEYVLEAGISIADIIGKMVRGDVFARKVTVAEGLSAYMVADIINAADGMQGHVAVPKEGSVLPDTYAYIRNDERAKILAHMQGAMRRTLDELWARRDANLPFKTKAQALALASIVEKETGIGAERARIAGVFVNRLRKGMRLQSDPTVIYAVTKGAKPLKRVLYKHLEIDSPYNTYKYAGIPPGPICNPGRAAIEAVLQPEKNDYLYFVADGTGGHVFARNVREHEANVLKWRRIQRKARAGR